MLWIYKQFYAKNACCENSLSIRGTTVTGKFCVARNHPIFKIIWFQMKKKYFKLWYQICNISQNPLPCSPIANDIGIQTKRNCDLVGDRYPFKGKRLIMNPFISHLVHILIIQVRWSCFNEIFIRKGGSSPKYNA